MKRLGIAAVLALVAAAGWPTAAVADATAETLRTVLDKVQPSLVIVSFYIEADDGRKAEARFLGSVVGENNLVMFTSLVIRDNVAISQYKDFRVIVPGAVDGKSYTAEYLGKDDVAQVAFVRVTDPSAPKLPPLEFEAAELQIGDPVVGFGNLGEPDAYKVMVQDTRVQVVIDKPFRLYPVDGDLGVPGTPVVTFDGKVVGLATIYVFNRGTNAQPQAGRTQIVWPTERFLERMKNPPEGGQQVKRPWMGVAGLEAVSEDLAEYHGLGERRGVVVGRIIAGSPSDKAGIKVEDLILSIGGKDIKGTEGQLVTAFQNEIRERKVGETVDVEVFRDGKVVPLKVTLEPQPKSEAEAVRYRNKQFGLGVRELVLDDTLVRELPNDEKGVIVHFIDSSGWADAAGLSDGDIIKKVQDREIAGIEDFERIFKEEVEKKPKEIVLFVLRGLKDKQTQLLRMEPRWDAAESGGGTSPGGAPSEPQP
ncbi:MAG TPA: PDZ domain-containing protein [Phycisphaerae bacterium]|nr:PDZ domain-containing protein [Phycisphaerae bacterium]HOI56614.1 PDZ domain-containing protein [Phycisphaerae bacterium]